MRVTVKLFASLRSGRLDRAELELPDAATVGEAVDAVGVRRAQAAIVFVNSRHADFGDPLSEGDILGLFPPVGGG